MLVVSFLILKLWHGNVWAVICSVSALLYLRCSNGCKQDSHLKEYLPYITGYCFSMFVDDKRI